MTKIKKNKKEYIETYPNHAVRITNMGTVFCAGQLCSPKRYADWMVRCEHCFVNDILAKINGY